MRRVVSVWLPDWPIERMRRQSPSAVPDDRPLALVESTSRGLRITAMNRAAAQEGVRKGIPLADARAALPALLSRSAEPAADRAALLKLARWAGRYGPARHLEGEDGLWIDATGVAHLFGGETLLLADLLRRLQDFGLTARLALAGTAGAAHALARFATGSRPCAIAPPGEERAALAPLPVEALRLVPEAALLLRRLGLRHIGQLATLPRTALERRFRDGSGSKAKAAASAGLAHAVLLRLDQALGLREEPRRPLAEPPLLEARRTWGEPLISSEMLMAEVAALSEELCGTLKEKELGARRLHLSLWRSDGSTAHITAGLAAPSRDPRHVMRLLEEKLAAIDAGFGIDVAALAVLGAERLEASQTALEAEAETEDMQSLAALADRLASRLGAACITCLAPHESHMPERAERRVAAMDAMSSLAKSPPPRATPGGERAGHGFEERPLRPPLLLAPPEPITVMAEVPEGPPRQFTWRRVLHRVVRAEGPERIAPEWWRAPGSPRNESARPRDYYRLEDETGARFWVFREGLYQTAAEDGAPRWLVHGLFG